MRTLGISLFGIGILACGGGEPPPAATPGAIASPSATVQSVASPTTPPAAPALKGLGEEEEAALDRSAAPCDDFFQFACGGWIKKTPIPDDEASWVRSFSVIRERNETMLREILEEASKSPSPTTKKIGDFYATCMDESTIDKGGKTAIDADLRAIDAIKDGAGVAKFVGKMHARGLSPLFGVGAQQDFADSTQMIGSFDQAGIGMPDRDYYLQATGKFPELKKKYEAHLAALFTLIGEKDAAGMASKVVKLETDLAQEQMSKEDRRDPKKIYHLTDREALSKVAPEFPWKEYLAELPAKDAKKFNVSQPAYLLAVGRFVKEKVSIQDWKAYLKANFVRASAPALSKPFVDEMFRWQSTLAGTAKLPPRWKRCVRATDMILGEALAEPFVQKTLGAEGKADVKDMIVEIESEMKKSLASLAWMDPATRAQAERKLSKIANKIAYPDVWRKYDALQIDRKGYFANRSRGLAFEQARQLAKIGKPVDRNEWYMTPPTVNAYYDPSMNEMVFLAGILQPPFYALKAWNPVKFGGIGMVMGHELTHGFDDEGRQFDADGNLKDWWSPQVNAEFEKRASCVEKQFDEFEVAGSKVNGKLTLGENLADLGGVKLALHALQSRMAKGLKMSSSDRDAMTVEQGFFVGYAQAWCGTYRDEAMRLLVATNPHSPPKLRVNGPLSNMTEFAKAFSCRPGNKMVRMNRCEVW